MSEPPPLTVWTIGHSNRSTDGFLSLLKAQDVRCVADVRRFAGSRTNPQFGPVPLEASLRAEGIDYVALPELGGRRAPSPTSENTVWRHPNFRGYADYMETPAFRDGLARLATLAAEQRTAMMCSEAVWWRCHRSMIADALKADGALVLHIMALGKAREHPYTSAARLVDGALRYGPAEA